MESYTGPFIYHYFFQEKAKFKRKKLLGQKMEDTIQKEASIAAPASHVREKILSASGDNASSLMAKLVQSAAVSRPKPYVPLPIASTPSVNQPKQERLEVASQWCHASGSTNKKES